MSTVLRASNLSVEFAARRLRLRRSRAAATIALRCLDLEIPKGGIVGIVGESGAGKSTLARALSGIIRPSTGTIHYRGEPIDYPRERYLARAIQMVPQDPGSSLNPALSVGAVLRELLRFHELTPPERIERDCGELMELVGLTAATLAAKPRVLSGGQRQRVALARALAVSPTVLIADEIVSALDSPVQAGILNLLLELHERLGLTIVLIAHDLAVVSAVCEHVLIMREGEILERGPVQQVFAAPTSAYTRSLLDAARRLVLPTVREP
jgi:ABC-type glutathione transport system ATPase component